VQEATAQIERFYAEWLNTTAAAQGPAGSDERRPRYEAFREAQRVAFKTAKQEWSGHPFFWASIVFVGDPGDLPPPPVGATATVSVN
jgi:hypothetical protein